MPDPILSAPETCPDCQAEPGPEPSGVSRREFFRTVSATVGGIAAVSAFAGAAPVFAQAAKAAGKVTQPETLVKTLYHSLTPMQKEAICKGWEDPLRSKVGANWAIVKPSIGE